MNTTEFEPIFRASSTPCVVLKPQDDQFLIVDANEAYLQITGSSAEDLLGKTSCEAFPKNPSLDYYGADILLESFKKVATQKEKDQMEVLRYDIPIRGSADFLEKYWSFENVPSLNSDGALLYVLHTIRDVTAQVLSGKNEKKLQREVEQKMQQFRHFVDSNTDGLYSLDKTGKFLNANQGLADITEVSVDQLLKINFLPFCSEEDRDYIVSNFEKTINGEATKFEARFVSIKGNPLFLEISLAPMMANGEVTGAYGITRDLTPLKKSEKIIVTKKNYLRANAAFISGLQKNGLEESSMQASMAIIGEAVDVDRIYYFLTHQDKETGENFYSLKREWTQEGVAQQIYKPELQNFPAKKMEELIGRLAPNQLFSANIDELPEGELKRVLQDQNTRSIMLLPIYLQDKLHGLIGFSDCIRERLWNEEEINFLQTLANSLITTFEKRAANAALKERERTLRLSEKKFKALVHEGTDMMAILDREGNYKFISESVIRILGFPPEEFLGRHPMEFTHPDDQAYLIQQISALEIRKQFKLAPFRFRNKAGEWRWLQTTLTNLLDDPAVQGIVGNTRDITRLLTQERQIKQINERYQLAARATQDLMYDWDLKTDKVTRFHKGTLGFLGHSVEAIDKRHFWANHIHPDELEALLQKEKDILLDREQDHIYTEYRFQRPDGSYAYLKDKAYIIRNAKGKAIRMVGATSDISALKANEEALKFSNKRFRLARKATKEVIWDWDLLNGKLTRGKAFKKITGFDLEKNSQHIGFSIAKIHHRDRERVQLSLDQAIQDPVKRKWREEYRLIKANGETAYIVDRAFIVREASGKAIRMVGSALDNTATRKAIKNFKKQNKLLREITWDQSHLLRAPLVRMQELLELVKMNDYTILSHNEIFQYLCSSTEEMDQIIRDIIKKSEQIEILD